MNPKLWDIDVDLLNVEAECTICGATIPASAIVTADELEMWLDDMREHLGKHA